MKREIQEVKKDKQVRCGPPSMSIRGLLCCLRRLGRRPLSSSWLRVLLPVATRSCSRQPTLLPTRAMPHCAVRRADLLPSSRWWLMRALRSGIF